MSTPPWPALAVRSISRERSQPAAKLPNSPNLPVRRAQARVFTKLPVSRTKFKGLYWTHPLHALQMASDAARQTTPLPTHPSVVREMSS